MKQAGISIEREVVPNGLVLVAEHMPHMRSVAIGIWVRAGSRGEPAGLNGIAALSNCSTRGGARRAGGGRHFFAVGEGCAFSSPSVRRQ